MKQMVFPMLRSGADPILAGRVEGEHCSSRILSMLGPNPLPTLMLLDFCTVELATASYLDEVTIKLRKKLGPMQTYPVAANMSAMVLEELEHLLRRANNAFLTCELEENSVPTKPRVLGTLEPKLEETYELVKRSGEASATGLHAEFGHAEEIGPTAWNNRLNTLVEKGLLLEIPLGRAKKYRPILDAQ